MKTATKYLPLKEIIIHQIEIYSIDTFLKNNVNPQTGSIGWCNGYAYCISYPPQTNDIVKEDVFNGIRHIQLVDLAKLPQHQDVLTNPLTKFQIPLHNKSESSYAKLVLGECFKHVCN